MEDDLRSSDTPGVPADAVRPDVGGDRGGEVDAAELISMSGDFPGTGTGGGGNGGGWWRWAAEILARRVWKDVPGVYRAPTPGGKMGGGGALERIMLLVNREK